MRDRLIELIKTGMDKHESTIENYVHPASEFVADYLLENGVIVPPCKVGDKVYRIVKEYNGETRVIDGEVFEITATHAYCQKFEYRFYFWANGEDFIRRNYSIWCNFTEVGKTVFLTREEAEQALKGGTEE